MVFTSLSAASIVEQVGIILLQIHREKKGFTVKINLFFLDVMIIVYDFA